MLRNGSSECPILLGACKCPVWAFVVHFKVDQSKRRGPYDIVVFMHEMRSVGLSRRKLPGDPVQVGRLPLPCLTYPHLDTGPMPISLPARDFAC